MKLAKMKIHTVGILALALGGGLAAALTWYYDVFVNWQPAVYPYVMAALFAGMLGLTLLVLWARGECKALHFIWKTLLSLAVFGVSIGVVTFVINNVFGNSAMAKQAATVALPLCAAQILVLLILLLRTIEKKQGWKMGIALVGVILAGVAAAWIAGQPSPLKLDTSTPLADDYALWESRVRQTLAADLSESIISADSGSLAWGSSYDINALCRAYQATGEELYLTNTGGYLYGIFQLAEDKDGDGYRNWGTGTYSDGAYQEWCVHTGVLLSSVGEWINLVYSVPGMLEKTEPVSGMAYGALCEYLITEATQQLIPAFDRDWNDALGIYMNRPGSGNFGGATDEISLPNNQFLAMASALIQFAKLSPEHEEEYLRRAKAMLDAFHSKLKFVKNGTVTAWNYKDAYFEGDRSGGTEDYSHGMHDVEAAMMGYANGFSFTLSEIEAFAATYKSMLRGTQAEPVLTWSVNGRGEAGNALFLYNYDLSPFGDVIWRAGYKTALFRGAPASAGDVARILVYHESAPAPLPFGLLAPQTNASGRTLLRWEPSIHACKYTLQVSDSEDFANLLVDRPNILATSAFVEGLSEGKTLYWRVIAANQSDGEYMSKAGEIST